MTGAAKVDISRDSTSASPVGVVSRGLDVFISYSRRDCLDFADQLAAALGAYGHRPVVDRHGIYGGEDWRKRLSRLILEAETIVFVLSPESTASEVCAWEVEEAGRLSKRILPVIALPLGQASIPARLKALNFIYFYSEPSVPGSGFGHGLSRLLSALEADLDWLREHRNMLVRSEAWEASHRDPDRLVRGNLLAEAELWLARRPANSPPITQLQHDFLEACRQAEEASKTAAAKQLAAISAAQEARAKALSDAEAALKQAADAQRRRARLRNMLLVFVICAAGLTSWLSYETAKARIEANNQRNEAALILQRARQAEQAASEAEAEAKVSRLKAVTNEFAASEALLSLNQKDAANARNYIETGTRLGFALIRNNRNAEAKRHFENLTQSLGAAHLNVDEDVIDFYRALIAVGAATAKIGFAKKDPGARSEAVAGLIRVVSDFGDEQFHHIQDVAWEEEVFRAHFYAANYSLDDGRYDVGFQIASKIDNHLSALNASTYAMRRLKVRAKGLLAWSAILDGKKEQALSSAEAAIKLAQDFNIKNLSFIYLNYAHALALNGRAAEAKVEYAKSNPAEVEKDLRAMRRAGQCRELFEEVSKGLVSCPTN